MSPSPKKKRNSITRIYYPGGVHTQRAPAGFVDLADNELKDTAKSIFLLASTALQPPEKTSLRVYADENRIMPADAVFPGRWRTDRIPAAVEPYEEFNNPLIKQFVFAFAVQTMKSELFINAILYLIEKDPCPMLLLQPDKELAKEFSTIRISGAASTMDYHAPYLNPGRAAKAAVGQSTTIEKRPFPGGFLRIGSVEGKSSLISTSYRYVFADEINKFGRNVGGDIKGRQTMYGQKAVRVYASSVGQKGHCQITPMWEDGDQREWNIKCPVCNSFHAPIWQNMYCKDQDPETARYRCPKCQNLLDNQKMAVANKNGKWIANKPFRGIASFRANAFCNPNIRLADLMDEFLTAEREYNTTGSDDLLASFWTDRMSYTYSPIGTGIEATAMDNYLRMQYPPAPASGMMTIPGDVAVITMAVDVQVGWFEAQWIGWGYYREKSKDTGETITMPRAFLLHRLQITADTSKDADYEKLINLYNNTRFCFANGFTKRAKILGVDTGFRSENVAKFVKRHKKEGIAPIKGRDRERSRLIQISTNPMTTDKYGNRLVWTETHLAKDMIYSMVRRSIEASKNRQPEKMQVIFPAGDTSKPESVRGFGMDALESIASEMLFTKKDSRGNVKSYYHRVIERNEGLDLFAYNLTLIHLLGINKLPVRIRDDDVKMRRQKLTLNRYGLKWQESSHTDTTPAKQ